MRGSLPYVNRTTLSKTIPAATVDISQASEPSLANGRTANLSTTAPHTPQVMSAMTMLAGMLHPQVTEKE